MTPTGLRAEIKPPVAAPRRHSLVDVAIDPDVDRWEHGVSTFPNSTDDVSSWTWPADADTSVAKDEGASPTGDDFEPFVIYVPCVQSTFGLLSEQEMVDRDTARLVAIEATAIEVEFATAALMTTNPALAGAPTLINAGTPLGVIEGYRSIDDALARAHGIGVVHISPRTAAWWIRYNLIEKNTRGEYETMSGHTVVIGLGYAGTKPTASPANGAAHEWAYGTAQVFLKRTPIEVYGSTPAERVDRIINKSVLRVERSVLVGWDTNVHLAVKIDHTTT